MPFPHHDGYWTDVVGFLRAGGLAVEPMTAPTEFNELFPTVYPYAESYAEPPPETPVVVVHKGMLDAIEPEFLTRVGHGCRPTFANEVFVVYSTRTGLPEVPADSPHLRALALALEARHAAVRVELARPAQPRPAFTTLNVEGVRSEMNRRYSCEDVDEFGGYEHPHLWDKARFAEVNRIFARFTAPLDGLRVLEIGCGIGRNVPLVAGCRSYLGTDLSDVAIARARTRHAGQPELQFRQMDAMHLDLPDSSFDVVVGVEIIEHVQDAGRLLDEVYRVLAPGGRFVFNSANRDSLHQRVVRALGLPESRSTHEHFREFGFAEMCEMLATVGFVVEASTGVFLHPYLGLPGTDARVREVTLDDPEIVAALREIGTRVGAEYGYEFVLAARKPT